MTRPCRLEDKRSGLRPPDRVKNPCPTPVDAAKGQLWGMTLVI
jgi:hypothetical protein